VIVANKKPGQAWLLVFILSCLAGFGGEMS
jgi:hypothetical protein